MNRLLAAGRARPRRCPLAACGGDDEGGADDDDDAHGVRRGVADRRFEELGEEFEAEHDGVEVEFGFGGSTDLVTQIQEGAPADVFASADTANMDELAGTPTSTGDDPQKFATNTLEIATPPDNPAGVATLPGPRERASAGASAPPRCRAARPRRRSPRTPA